MDQIKKADVSSTFIENIFRSRFTLVSFEIKNKQTKYLFSNKKFYGNII